MLRCPRNLLLERHQMNVKPTKGYICKTSGLYLNHDDGHPIQHTNFGVARDIDCQLTDTPLREYNPYLEKHTTEYPWDLEPTERLLWDFLIHKFNQDYRGLWWSTRKIALRLKKTPRTIEAALKKLIAKKWIEVEKPGGVNGKKRVCVFDNLLVSEYEFVLGSARYTEANGKAAERQSFGAKGTRKENSTGKVDRVGHGQNG